VSDFVLDASVALSWFVDRPVAPYAARVRQALVNGSRATVPPLWRVEVPNGLVVAERRRILSPSDTTLAVQKLELLLSQSIDSAVETVSLTRVLSSSRQYRLTAYDACYLDLAREQRLPLATLDRRLREAALLAGVTLLS
jgi:predicted nucleic acid-binding protein